MKLGFQILPGTSKCALFCSCVCCFVGGCTLAPSSAVAAPTNSSTEQSIQEHLTPPRLIRQVELIYPPEALDSQMHGDVSVVVTVDNQGRVIHAEFEEGDAVFKKAALDAARKLEFEPASRDGQAVSVSTRVFFHFAPPADFGDTPGMEIVVHAEHPDLSDSRARTTLDEEDLEESAGDALAETVSQVAGVRTAGLSSDSSKPIIRGHQERRLLVLNDGVRHESQKWGPDHAPEIDPFSAGSISVIRGAAGTRYGPDAIGGVILIEPPSLRTSPGVEGKVLTAYNTNGRRPYGALRLDAGSERGLLARVEGNVGVGASQTTPDYVLGNTASKTWNLGTVVAQELDSGRITASWHHHQSDGGVFYGVVNATPSEFEAQLEFDQPVSADLWEVSYDIDRTYQSVSHDVAMVKTELSGDWGILEAIYSFQINLRQEFEQVREDITGPQFDFTLRTHALDSFYQHPVFSTALGDFEGGAGVQGTFQENVYRGLPLIPNFRSFAGGVFGYERLSMRRVDLELGARLDGLSRATYLDEQDYETHVRGETLDEASCEALEYSYRCPADYMAGSVSLGGLAHVVPDHFDIKVDLSTAVRFPNVDELYIIGHSPSLPVYATGFPDLGTETVWNASLTSGLRSSFIEAEASVYAQVIEDYIYFSPVLNPSGNPKMEVTIRGAYPGWDFRPIDAQFFGLDGSLEVGPELPVGFRAVGGLTRGQERSSGIHLVGTPADYLSLALIGRAPALGGVQELEVDLNVELVAAQSRVDPALDFAAPPPGYALFGAGINAVLGRTNKVRVGIDATNLLNTSYRDYSSLLRYYADRPGRDIRVRAGMNF